MKTNATLTTVIRKQAGKLWSIIRNNKIWFHIYHIIKIFSKYARTMEHFQNMAPCICGFQTPQTLSLITKTKVFPVPMLKKPLNEWGNIYLVFLKWKVILNVFKYGWQNSISIILIYLHRWLSVFKFVLA